MLGLEALCLGDAWNVGLGSLCTVTGPAEDLKIIVCAVPAKSYGHSLINVPKFSGRGDFDPALI